MRYEEQGIDPEDIVEDGAEMEWNGHKLTFVLSPCCTGCFFMDKGEVCPKCEDGIWIEKNPNPWHTGTPTEDGDYLVAFRMSDNSVEYGWCNWNNGAWDILCDYDPTNGSCGMVAWQKIEKCNWFDFLFSEGHCDNWREARKGEN